MARRLRNPEPDLDPDGAPALVYPPLSPARLTVSETLANLTKSAIEVVLANEGHSLEAQAAQAAVQRLSLLVGPARDPRVSDLVFAGSCASVMAGWAQDVAGRPDLAEALAKDANEVASVVMALSLY